MINCRLSEASFIGALLIVLASCSSAPATRYYALSALESNDESAQQKNNEGVVLTKSIGVGPVIVPEYLDVTGIVSKSSQRVYISGGHAWAEPLDKAISRVFADNISQLTQNDLVWSFPWDNRIRPELQVRIVVEQLEGQRGLNANFKFKWIVYNTTTKTLLAVGTESLSESLTDESYTTYISALNTLVERASKLVLVELAKIN